MSRTTPARGAIAITPADDGSIVSCRSLYIGTGGDIKVDMVGSGTEVLFVGVPSGSILPIEATRVYDTDTDADNIVALF